MLALKILLIAVLIALVVAALAAWWLVTKLKGVVKAVTEAGGLKDLAAKLAGGAGTFPPCRVNPTPVTDPKWRNAAEIEQFTAQFLAAGFQSVGAFAIPEMAGMQIAVFAQEAERLYGIIYDHTKLPPNFDIACTYEDGTDLTVCNTNYAAAMDRPPGSPAIRLDGGTVADALAALQQHKETSARKAVKPDEFAAHFQAAYKKDMNWRLKRGGSTREEIRRQALKEGGEVTDEMIDHVYFSQRAAAMVQLQAGCIAQYLDDQKAAPAGWEEIKHRVFAIPDIFTPEEVRETLESNLDLDEEQTHQLEKIELTFGQNALDFMDQVLAGKAGPLMLERIGSVQEPVPAGLFLGEESKDDSDESDDE